MYMNKLAAVVSAVALMMSVPAVSAADSFFDCIKEAGRTIGHTTRDVTREIGHASRDATREVGHAFRDGFSDGDKGKTEGNNKEKAGKKDKK